MMMMTVISKMLTRLRMMRRMMWNVDEGADDDVNGAGI